MKKKIIVPLAALTTLLSLSFGACGQENNEGNSQPTGINAESSAKTSKVSESEGQTVAPQGDQTGTSAPAPEANQIQNGKEDKNNGASPTAQNQGSEITEDQAKQIAFDHAQVKEGDLNGVRVKKDLEDGLSIYEIEFYAGNKEYEYDIKASDGQILKTEFDIDKDYIDSSTVQVSFPEADARAAALAKVSGATENDLRMKLEREDGILVYEGKIIYNNMEYDFEIDANSGAFLEWEQESVFD